MGKNYKDTFAKLINNPEYRKEWDESEPEREALKAAIKEKVENNTANRKTCSTYNWHQCDYSKAQK